MSPLRLYLASVGVSTNEVWPARSTQNDTTKGHIIDYHTKDAYAHALYPDLAATLRQAPCATRYYGTLEPSFREHFLSPFDDPVTHLRSKQ